MKEIEITQFPEKLPGSFWGITTFYNPQRYKNKIENYRKFRNSIKKQGLELLTVELAFGNDDFELKHNEADKIVRVRCNSVMWQKERLLNIGLKNLPEDCDKIAWLDADIIFLNKNWVSETSKLLEDYAIVQPFSCCVRLPKGNPKLNLAVLEEGRLEGEKQKGVVFAFISSHGLKSFNDFVKFHPGFAWAGRKKIFDELGFYDKLVASTSSDTLMAFSFLKNLFKFNLRIYHGKIKSDSEAWSGKMYEKTSGSVYYDDGTVLHLFHGSMNNRLYGEVDKLMSECNYDPNKDIKLNKSCCWEWTGNNKALEAKVKNYFKTRNEEGKLHRDFMNVFFDDKRKILLRIDRQIGLFGRFLKRHSPRLYFLLKRFKK